MGQGIYAQNAEDVNEDAQEIRPSSYQVLLDRAREEAQSGATAHIPVTQQALLNGVPYKAFRQSVPLEDRRQAGTFFSSANLAQELANLLRSVLPPGARALDPSCGMGDLLLAYAAELPMAATLLDTLTIWSEQLAGIDPRPDLIVMAKARLIALARARGGFSDPIGPFDETFPHILVGDMFERTDLLATADGFLFNPPFGGTSAHKALNWATGKLSSAALFLDALITAAPNAPIAAVLPEVLRCGSRYACFRSLLTERGKSGGFMSRGRFDVWTDVDVFTTLLKTEPGKLWLAETQAANTVGDHFTVRVGPVVPHRHENKGLWRRFICAKTVPAWNEGFTPTSNKRFEGTIFTPPFVVVRRTSSPSDRKRAVGAIIVGDRPVAIENHLIALLPNDGGYERCQELLTVLRSELTSDYLNRTIRCRHLTTGSIKAIPWCNE